MLFFFSSSSEGLNHISPQSWLHNEDFQLTQLGVAWQLSYAFSCPLPDLFSSLIYFPYMPTLLEVVVSLRVVQQYDDFCFIFYAF